MRISDWSSDVCSSDLQLADAFGTRSSAVISLFMSQLESLCGRGIWDEAAHQWRMQESEMSAILALVNAFRPKNEPEAMLAAKKVRSEARRVGKECVSKCRSRGEESHKKKKENK